MQHADLLTRIEAIERLMAERLHLSTRGGLEAQLRGARGRLPRAVRVRGGELVKAKAMLAAPSAARALDPGHLRQTCDLIERHLQEVPEGKYRRRARSALWGGIALQVLVVLGVALVVIRWRGLG